MVWSVTSLPYRKQITVYQTRAHVIEQSWHQTSACAPPKLQEFLLSREFPLAVEAQETIYCRKKKEQAIGVSVLHWIGPIYALLLKNLMNILLAVPGVK